uniref:RNA helicase n=1 Tax=Steinernema glaseri TaxID=37863 RepID=A0A1I8A9Z1_9BILA
MTDLSAWLPYGLPEEVMKGIEFLKFAEPSNIQKEVLPYAVQHRMDILGAAETGSGKTLAFAIPLICRLLETTPEERRLRAIVLTPTRELAIQVHGQMQHILKFTKLKSMIIVGGLSQQKQERLISGKPDIIVATPGRFWKLVSESLEDEYLADFSGVECVVVDETDRMIEKGHFEEVQELLNHIHQEAPENRQTMLFSATLTYVHSAPKRLQQKKTAQGVTADEKIEKIVEKAHLRSNHKVIDITRKFGTAEKLVESRMTCKDLLEKDANVFYLLKRYPGRTLIFMNSIDACRRFYAILMKLKVEPIPMMLHAKMHQRQRLKNLERFASMPNSILLSTDVAARGLDIKGVEHVIHYQVPKTAEIYVHRSGRTARAAMSGVTVLMVDPIDAHFYERIKKNLNRDVDLKLFPIDSTRLYEHLKKLIHLAGQSEAMEHRMKKVTGSEKWWEKMAKQADIELDELVLGKKDRQVADEVAHYKNERKQVESELKHMLSMPLPRADIKKTRYVNPEVVKSYDAVNTADALTSLATAVTEDTADVKKIKRRVLHSAGMREFMRRERKKQKKLGKRRKH